MTCLTKKNCVKFGLLSCCVVGFSARSTNLTLLLYSRSG